MLSGERYTKYTLQSSLFPKGLTTIFEAFFIRLGLVCRGPIYCTSIKYESRLHTKNLIDPHSGQTTPKGLAEGFAHASLADTPTNSLRVPSRTCFPGLLRHAHAVEYWAKEMLLKRAPHPCCKRVNRARLKCTAEIESDYLIGCTAPFLGAL